MEETMGRWLTKHRILSMMDDPSLYGLMAYLNGSRWLRDSGGHDTGGNNDDPDADPANRHAADEDESDDDTDDDTSSGDDDKSKKKDESDDDKPKYTQAEYDRMRDRMRGADKAKAAAEKALAEFKVDGSKLDEATKREIGELKPKIERLTGDNRDLRLKVAFLSTTLPGVEWVDVEDALRLVDLSDVDIDEDGNVDKRDLRLALKTLAKKKPHLVKKAATRADDEDDTDDKSSSSGSRMNGKRRGQKTETDRAALAKRFPVLNQR